MWLPDSRLEIPGIYNQGIKSIEQTEPDFSDPLFRGLVWYMPINRDLSVYESNKLINPAWTEANVTYSPTIYGMSKEITSAGTGYFYTDAARTKARITNRITFFVDYIPLTATGNVFAFGNVDVASGTYTWGFYYLNATSEVRAYMTTSSAANAGNGSSPLGERHFLTGVYDGTNIILYIDGVLIDTTPLTGTISTSSNYFSFNRWNSFGRITAQYLDAGIYNRALNNNEVVELYRNRFLRFYPK